VDGVPTKLVGPCRVQVTGRLVADWQHELVLVIRPRTAVSVDVSVLVFNWTW